MGQRGGVFTLILVAALVIFVFFVLIALMGFSPVTNSLTRCSEQSFSKMQKIIDNETNDTTVEELCFNMQNEIEAFKTCEKAAEKDLSIPIPRATELLDWYTKQSIPSFKQLTDFRALYDSKCLGVNISN